MSKWMKLPSLQHKREEEEKNAADANTDFNKLIFGQLVRVQTMHGHH